MKIMLFETISGSMIYHLDIRTDTNSVVFSHYKALEAVTTFSQQKGCGRFGILFQALKANEFESAALQVTYIHAVMHVQRVKNFVFIQVACIQFANALVSQPDELDFRLHLRNEFLRSGLREQWVVRQRYHSVCPYVACLPACLSVCLPACLPVSVCLSD